MLPFIRFILKLGMLILLFPFRIFKIKNNRIILLNNILNFDATYSCNTKYISEYLIDNMPGVFEIIYPLGKNREKIESKNIIFVTLGSLKYYYYVMTSKFFITTSGAIAYIPFRKKQFIINTWHGGGAYKKMGLDSVDNIFYRWDCMLTERKTSYFLSSNKYFSQALQTGLLIQSNKILEIGMPRNDLFFKNSIDISNKVKKYFNISKDTKIVLYAPTYRTNMGNPFLKHEAGLYNIKISEVLKNFEKIFGGKWIFALKVHPSIVGEISIVENNVINMSEYEDVQELLCAADILINDYSSIMWDFVQTYKPCFIYANDLDEYTKRVGFYTSPSSWPFPLAKTNEELSENILKFNMDNYILEVKKYFEWMENFEKGNSCEILANLMLNILKKEEIRE